MASQLKKLRRAAAIMHQPTPMLPIVVDEAARLRVEERAKAAEVAEVKPAAGHTRKGFGLRHLIPILAFLGAGEALKKQKGR